MVTFDFDEKVDSTIEKSVKSTLRFYNEIRKAALLRGEKQDPPTFDAFVTMAKGLMQATKEADLERIRNPGLKDHFERAWANKLLNYATQRQLKEAYETLLHRF